MRQARACPCRQRPARLDAVCGDQSGRVPTDRETRARDRDRDRGRADRLRWPRARVLTTTVEELAASRPMQAPASKLSRVRARGGRWSGGRPARLAPVGLCLLALVGSLACCGSARADAASWTLRWSAPSACPNEQAVRQLVESWLTQSIAPNDPRGIRVGGTRRCGLRARARLARSARCRGVDLRAAAELSRAQSGPPLHTAKHGRARRVGGRSAFRVTV